jgi:hypothetical protein
LRLWRLDFRNYRHGRWLDFGRRRRRGRDLNESQTLAHPVVSTRASGSPPAASNGTGTTCPFVRRRDLTRNEKWRRDQQRENQYMEQDGNERTRFPAVILYRYADRWTVWRTPSGRLVAKLERGGMHHGAK